MNLRALVIFALPLWLVLGATSNLLAVGPTPPTWKPPQLISDDCLNNPSDVNSQTSLAFDHHGNPGVVYVDAGWGLRYARFARGIGWTSQLLAPFSGPTRPSLAFDNYERPCIAYTIWNDPTVRIIRFGELDYSTEVIDNNASEADVQVAFDRLGRMAIAYTEIETGVLVVRYRIDLDNDGQLNDEVEQTAISSPVDDVRYPSLAFDLLNRPMIAAQRIDAIGPAWAVTFAVREPGIGWVSVDLAAQLSPMRPSLAINPVTGRPSVAWESQVGYIQMRTWTGSGWVGENPNLGSPAACEIDSVSLAFDPADGRPTVAWTDNGPACVDFNFSWFDGAVWNTQTATSFTAGVDNTYAEVSLAFNDYGTGFPSFVFMTHDGVSPEMYYIEDPPAADINGDFFVGIDDLLRVIANWGACPPKQECTSDIAPQPGGNGNVGIEDLLLVLGTWS